MEIEQIDSEEIDYQVRSGDGKDDIANAVETLCERLNQVIVEVNKITKKMDSYKL